MSVSFVFPSELIVTDAVDASYYLGDDIKRFIFLVCAELNMPLLDFSL